MQLPITPTLRRKLTLWTGAIVIFTSGMAVGNARTSTVRAQRDNPGDTALFEPFWEVWDVVHNNYMKIDDIDDKTLVEGAMTGMVAALGDRNSAYMSPTLYERINATEYGGLGASVRKDEATGGLRIIATTKGTPAREQLRVGDVIIFVNGENITTLTETQIIGKVRGPEGTTIVLGILREGERGVIDIVIKRANIATIQISTAIYDGNIGYIALANFDSGADSKLSNALESIDAENLDGLILDLRGNPGGGLTTAINIASMFIEEGAVVIQRNKEGVDDVPYYANGEPIAPTVPMVLLVNGSSASASELIAGMMRDYGRAVVIGTTTFGKGSVQLWSDVSDGGGIRVTIANFLSPNGTVIEKVGVRPDIYVLWDYDAQPDYDPQLAEALAVLRGEAF